MAIELLDGGAVAWLVGLLFVGTGFFSFENRKR